MLEQHKTPCSFPNWGMGRRGKWLFWFVHLVWKCLCWFLVIFGRDQLCFRLLRFLFFEPTPILPMKGQDDNHKNWFFCAKNIVQKQIKMEMKLLWYLIQFHSTSVICYQNCLNFINTLSRIRSKCYSNFKYCRKLSTVIWILFWIIKKHPPNCGCFFGPLA